jgi:peptide/nickel transport system permease protein
MKATAADRDLPLTALPAADEATRSRRLRQAWRLKWGLGAGAFLLVVVLLTIFAAAVAPHDPLAVNIRHRLAPPAWMDGGASAHLLGTDQVGRDLLSRIIYGGRVSLVVGVGAVLVSTLIGVALGLGAGYFGGRTDWTIMTLVNVMLTFPFVLLALAVIAVLGPSLTNMIIVLGVAGWPVYCRVVRTEGLALREREFVLAARALGARDVAIIGRHILPNTVSPLIVQATISFPVAILAEAALSYLGLGTQPPHPSWGLMLRDAQSFLSLSPWFALFPGAAIALAVLGFNLLGDGLRDVLDPRGP